MALPDAFLTYGWCRVSYVILASLAARGVRVHVGDSSRLAMCRYSRYRASYSRYRSPYRDPVGFVDDVAKALSRTGARVLLPGHDDAAILARHADRLPRDVTLPVAPAEDLVRAGNKWSLMAVAEKAGVPTPRSFKPGNPAELRERAAALPYPAVVKTQIGNSAKGVAVVNDPDECVARFEQLVTRYRLSVQSWPIVQEFLPGEGYGVCVLYNRGRLRAAFCERYLRAKDGRLGTSVFRESLHAPALVEHAKRLLDALGWHGVAQLDFVGDLASGKLALIEMNPRFWGALDLAVRSGVDFPWLLYRMAVDGDVAAVSAYRDGVRSRWLVGEALHLFNHARRGQLRSFLRSAASMATSRADGHDDFRASDPLPLPAEALYYLTRFLATGNTNPVEDGMLG